jgi:hypothetical protein
VPFERRGKDADRKHAIAAGTGDEHVGSGRRNELNIAVHDRRHRDRAAGGQDMLEIDAFFFEVAFALSDPNRREVQTGGGSGESYFNGRFGLGPKRHRRAR